MKSRLWIAGALLVAASIYPVAGMASDRMVAEYLSAESWESGSQGTESPADMSSGPAVEGTEQKGEIETGTVPAGETGDSQGKSGFEAFEPQPKVIDQGGLEYRTGVDDGP